MPCYNEEGTLAIALKALPREVAGVDKVEWLIINDGSSDRTIEVARENGVDHVVDLGTHQGLARGFMAGLRTLVVEEPQWRPLDPDGRSFVDLDDPADLEAWDPTVAWSRPPADDR